ncbi:MAG: DEAD/DEAH box helicase, partial [Phascolarctobacterium sp.]|nr:DEAD/DEAH box helicase [Phascolarctobacterium sp.]
MLDSILKKIFGDPNEKELKQIRVIVDKINSLEKSMESLSSANLAAKTSEFKVRLQKGETLDDLLPEAFAVVREASRRVTGMRHFDVQMIGGVVLHRGKIAEMRTGEGKTLVATLPVYLNALTGKGVHVVTVNDYLAKRDSEDMGRIYKFLGLSVGLIVHDMNPHERRAAYMADVTYGTNNEFGFDYLRDNMVVNVDQMVQRELNYCIVDEVDSILIDEARTPLIISGPGEKSTDLYRILAQVSGSMSEGEDYTVVEKNKTVAPTEICIAKAEKMLGIDNMYDTEHGIDFSHQLMCALKA